MDVVGKRRIVHMFLLAGGFLCMPMYEAMPPNKIVGSLLYRRKEMQIVRGRNHL